MSNSAISEHLPLEVSSSHSGLDFFVLSRQLLRRRSVLIDALELRRLFSAPGLAWPLQFDDEFNTTTLDTSKWSMYLPWSNGISGDNRYHDTNNAYASYMEPQDVSVSGGSLQLSTQQGNFYSAANGHWFGYSEGMITTNSSFWYEYGYAEIRAEMPTGVGNWPAFWSLSSGWPPENDIMEAGPGTGINHQGIYDMSSTWHSVDPATFPANTWHTYGLQWGPGTETFYEDGVATLTVNANIPAEGMYFLLNSGVATSSDANYSNANNNTLKVDYIHVYGYNASTGAQLINGSMEAYNSGFTASSNNYGGWSVNTASPRTGYDDLEINGSGGSQPVITGLLPSTSYTFSAYGYSNTVGSYGLIGVKGYGGTETSTPFAQTAWGQDAVNFTTGSTNTTAQIYLYNPTSAITYYDDASLEVTPTISAIANTGVSPGGSVTVPIPVNQGGSGTNFTITASSSNTTVIKNSDLTIGGTAAAPTVIINSEAGQAGTSTITLNLTDIYGGTATRSFVVSSLNAITVNGDVGGITQNDVFRLVRSGINLNMYENNNTNTPTQQYNYSSAGVVNVNGFGGNNQLILDYSGGDPVPSAGLSFNGGSGSNTLTLQNMPGTESAILKNGSLVIGSDNIAFTSTQNLSLDLGPGSSTLLSTTPTLTSTLSLTVDSGSTLSLLASSTLPTNSILNVAGTLNLGNQSESIDQLTGSGTVNTGTSATQLTVGSNGGSSTFNGSITGSASLQKIGAGTFTLAGTNTFTGQVYIGSGVTTGGNVNGALAITNASAFNGTTQVNFLDNNAAYSTLQLNGASINLPATLAFSVAANSAGPGTTAAMDIDSILGNNTIAGPFTFGVGGLGYRMQVDAGTLSFTGAWPATSHVLYLSGAGSGSFTAALGGSASILSTGNWTLGGIETYTGATNVSSGTLTIPAGDSLADTSVISSAGANLIVNGTLSSSTVLTANGTVTFGANPGTGILARTLAGLAIGNAGVVTIAMAAVHSNRTLLIASGLSLAGSASTLNINNNDLDLPGASLSTISTLVGQGSNGGTWTGNGITSTAAATDPTHLTALGTISNNQNSSALYGSSTTLGNFDGFSPAPTDVLVKFTYYGDANLDGKVDASDYSLIDSGFLNSTTGWFNGNFNFDTAINGSDYTLIDNAFNTQGQNLTANAILAPTRAAALPPSATVFSSTAINFNSGDDRRLIKKVVAGIDALR